MSSSFFKGGVRASVVLILSFLVFVLSSYFLTQLYVAESSYESPLPGGVLSEGVVGEVRAINPLLSQHSEAEEDIVSLVFSGLTKYDPKQRRIVPDLATFEVNSNATEFTFRLFEEAVWHDGVAVTADDVVFTYELIQDVDFPNTFLQSRFANVKVEKVDDKTVKFVLPSSYYYFPTSTTIGIVPKHLWSSVYASDIVASPLNRQPIGSGPYMMEEPLSSSETGPQVISLVRNDAYYGDIPYLEGVSFYVLPTFDEVLQQRNALTAIKSIPYSFVENVRDSERFDLHEVMLPKYFAAFLNVESEFLLSNKTRQALQLATDRSHLFENVQHLREINSPFLQRDTESWEAQFFPDRAAGGLYDAGWRFPTDELVELKKKNLIAAYALTQSGSLLTEETEVVEEETVDGDAEDERDTTTVELGIEDETTVASEEDGTDEETASEVEEAPVQPDLSGIAFEDVTINGKRGVDLLEEYQKYRVNEDGVVFTLKLVTLDSPSYLQEMAEKMAEGWERLGAKVLLDVQPAELITETIRNRDYDVILIGQELGYDQDVFAYWHSSSAKRSGFNLSNFKDNDVDKYLEQLRNPKNKQTQEAVEEERLDIITKINRVFQEEVPAIFLFQQKGYFAVDTKYKNVYIKNIITPKDRFAYLYEWYEKTGKQPREELTFTNMLSWVINNLQ